MEPEVDLSSFLERQRLSEAPSLLAPRKPEDEEEIDHTLAHISSRPNASAQTSRKGRVQSIEWNDELDQMNREMAAAEATRGMHRHCCFGSLSYIYYRRS